MIDGRWWTSDGRLLDGHFGLFQLISLLQKNLVSLPKCSSNTYFNYQQLISNLVDFYDDKWPLLKHAHLRALFLSHFQPFWCALTFSAHGVLERGCKSRRRPLVNQNRTQFDIGSGTYSDCHRKHSLFFLSAFVPFHFFILRISSRFATLAIHPSIILPNTWKWRLPKIMFKFTQNIYPLFALNNNLHIDLLNIITLFLLLLL